MNQEARKSQLLPINKDTMDFKWILPDFAQNVYFLKLNCYFAGIVNLLTTKDDKNIIIANFGFKMAVLRGHLF